MGAFNGRLSTGEHDKNGRLIFEGDVIRDGGGDLWVVYWCHYGLWKRPIDDNTDNNRSGLHSLRFYEVVEDE